MTARTVAEATEAIAGTWTELHETEVELGKILVDAFAEVWRLDPARLDVNVRFDVPALFAPHRTLVTIRIDGNPLDERHAKSARSCLSDVQSPIGLQLDEEGGPA